LGSSEILIYQFLYADFYYIIGIFVNSLNNQLYSAVTIDQRM
jgi:hypothetical protein